MEVKEIPGSQGIATAPNVSPAETQTRDLFFDKAGHLTSGLNVDRVWYLDQRVVISGWLFSPDVQHLTFTSSNQVPAQVLWFGRPDVLKSYRLCSKAPIGFLATFEQDFEEKTYVQASIGEDVNHRVEITNLEASDSDDIDELVADHAKRLGFLFKAIRECPAWVSVLVRSAFDHVEPEQGIRGAGHIEDLRAVTVGGGLAIGWAISLAGGCAWLVTEEGAIVDVCDSARWDRADVNSAFLDELGAASRNAGFVQFLPQLRPESTVVLIGFAGDAATLLARKKSRAIADDPIVLARWAFQLRTPSSTLCDRMRNHDGRFIRASMERHRFTAPTRALRSKHFGQQPPSPLVTMAIPLFGRYDFIDHQLLEFALDDWIIENCEIVYFVDDPSIVDGVLHKAEILVQDFGVSFVVCWTGINHGFAAATNLASRTGRGEYVLMLNSDVIPIKAGWLHGMLKGLKSDPSLGIVGAQLLSSSGGIQHNGMICIWEPAWGSYLNKHPNSGLAPSAVSEDDMADKALVTAACLLVSRRTFEQVGGLNEEYLIGDFEDSDFCFKVRSLGLKIACLQSRSLIHLERQSFVRIGDCNLREYIARLNAIIHTERWKEAIEGLPGAVQ